MRLPIAASLLAALIAFQPPSVRAQTATPAAGQPPKPAAQAPRGPSFDCSRASSRVEKAVCDEPTLSSMDRLLATAYALVLESQPREADAWKADQRRWLASRDATMADPTNYRPLIRAYEERLRLLIRRAGPAALHAALEVVRPIDPLQESGAQAEEVTAFVAFVLTSLYPDPPAPAAPDAGDEVLSAYERLSGFTYIGRLADGRLLAAVAVDCFAYQCVAAPYLLNPKAGTAVRAAVDLLDKDGKRHTDPHGLPLGMMTVSGNEVEVYEMARGSGDCGTRWYYRAEKAALRLVKSIAKPECDGKEWTKDTTKVKSYR